MALADLLPEEDYRFQLRFDRGDPAQYFHATANHDRLIAERIRWLRSEPENYSALTPDGISLLDEAIEFACDWNRFPKPGAASPHERLLALGECWEPDFLLLRAGSDGTIRLHGGCVCFPSSWRLSEKVGQAMEFIHGPVPGLNENIGASIHKFLSQLKAGVAWKRTNWGLSGSPELNQHPDRSTPRLKSAAGVDDVWLRVEHQALVALPASGGILFGIRIAVHSLSEILADVTAARRLKRALETMPQDVARYKNLLDAKQRIIELLT